MSLDVPNLVQTVSFYRDVLLNAVETMKQLIKRNNDLRLSIDNVFIRISRPVFRKLDEVFKDGLKTVQWDSKDLATYFTEVNKVLSIVTIVKLKFNQMTVHHPGPYRCNRLLQKYQRNKTTTNRGTIPLHIQRKTCNHSRRASANR